MGARPWDRGRRGWWVRVYANGKEEKYRVGPPGPEGEAKAKQVCAEIERRAQHDELWTSGATSRALPVDGMLYGWMEIHGPLRSERTQLTDRGRVAHLADFFGSLDIRDLTDGAVRLFANELLKQKSGHTVAGCLSLLRRVLNLAVREGLIPANPVPTINEIMRAAKVMTDEGANQPDAWTQEEWVQIWAAAEKHEPGIAAAVMFAFHTGARRGEIISLRWEDVDFSRHRINFLRTARLRSGTKRLKSHFKPRTMPMSPELEARLKQQLEQQRRAQLEGKPEPEWVFPSPRGHFWSERNFSRTWERLRRRFLKLGVRPLKFHCARHTFITWALESGKSTKRVSTWVGASEEVIQSSYSHLLPDDDGVDFLGAGFDDEFPHQTAPDDDDDDVSARKDGDPGAIRTRDPQLRRLVLYPAELPGHSRRKPRK